MHGPKWPFLLILVVYGPGVVVVNCWDMFCTLGRAPRRKKALPDFHEWCRVTRHPRVFRGLMGCQRTPRFWGVIVIFFIFIFYLFIYLLFLFLLLCYYLNTWFILHYLGPFLL